MKDASARVEEELVQAVSGGMADGFGAARGLFTKRPPSPTLH